MDGLNHLCKSWLKRGGEQPAGGKQGWQPAGTIPASPQHGIWGLGAAPQLTAAPCTAHTPQSPVSVGEAVQGKGLDFNDQQMIL